MLIIITRGSCFVWRPHIQSYGCNPCVGVFCMLGYRKHQHRDCTLKTVQFEVVLFGGRIYNLDSLMGVIPVLVFSICWDTGNTNIGIAPLRLSRLYMQPSNKQPPHVVIINILHFAFYHSTLVM
jgi:hypothetical protein